MDCNLTVSISKGNSKMGAIPSISLPAGKTCSDCGCYNKCYARRIEYRYKNSRDAYQRNLDILHKSPEDFWRAVTATIMCNRYFRFHVSGDIPDENYLLKMLDVVSNNQHCEVLCFTKKYSIVNKVLERGLTIPKNLHLIFSAWRDYRMDNPFVLPEAHIRYRDGYLTTQGTYTECGGNCTQCAIENGGCWSLRSGDRLVIEEH